MSLSLPSIRLEPAELCPMALSPQLCTHPWMGKAAVLGLASLGEEAQGARGTCLDARSPQGTSSCRAGTISLWKQAAPGQCMLLDGKRLASCHPTAGHCPRPMSPQTHLQARSPRALVTLQSLPVGFSPMLPTTASRTYCLQDRGWSGIGGTHCETLTQHHGTAHTSPHAL